MGRNDIYPAVARAALLHGAELLLQTANAPGFIGGEELREMLVKRANYLRTEAEKYA